ncbi:MAG: PIN domain-containing protein [Anaerolineae bacterium]|nr:PIN domain-containing protein [Anaerolineae bacterium]
MTVRSVLDTNIWVSGIIWRGRPYRIRKLGQEQTFILVTSLPILVEVTRVLREYFEFSDELA